MFLKDKFISIQLSVFLKKQKVMINVVSIQGQWCNDADVVL